MESGQETGKLFTHLFKFKHPATIAVAGPTQAGKTQYVIQLLKNSKNIFTPAPSRILWAYGQKNDTQMKKIANAAPNVEFFEGFPNLEDVNENTNNLLVLDDLMNETGKNIECSKLFTQGSHHKNITVISIIHNLFSQDRYTKTMALNTRYYVLFKSPRDNAQIKYFGRQMFPSYPKFIPDSYRQATEKPYETLIIDLHPQTPDSLRVYSGILPHQIPMIYQPTSQ